MAIANNVFVGGYAGPQISLQAGPVTFTGNQIYVGPGGLDFIGIQLDTGQSLSNYTVDNNSYYGVPVSDGTFRFGRYSYDAAGDGNYFSNLAGWQMGMVGSNGTNFDLHSTYSASAPSGEWIYVRPNAYETKRANVTIYNWDLAPSVAVDLSKVLSVGDSYVIQDAQNFYGPPVASGTYEGATVNIPMTGLTKATPIGVAAPAHTAPLYGVFIVLPAMP